jgi:hypothetical protein
MRRYLLVIGIFLLIPFAGFSQYDIDYGGKLGASNYLGAIGGLQFKHQAFVADMKLDETRWNIGGYFRYKIRDPWSVMAELNWVRISGADSLTTLYDPRRGRNLNFRNDIIQLNLLGQWTFFENPDLGNTYRYQNSFSAWLATGISIFYQDPFGYGDPPRADGSRMGWGWYNLHPLETEGVHYHLIQPGIPMEAGFDFTIKKKYRIGWSLTWTKTFTGYLDDVHGTYPNPSVWNNLSPDMRAEAAYFSNRTPQLVNTAGVDVPYYGVPGAPRGYDGSDPATKNAKDSFLTTTINAGYVIRGRSNFYHRQYSGLFSKNRFKVRRRRAKF